jgi:hypothetical protein
MEENQTWPFIFTGVASLTFATLSSDGLFIRARHRQNLELIASSFPNVVNFSLNFMENGTLKFRTLFETNIDMLARNPVLAQILSDSRDCCTEERAFFSEPRQKKSLFSRSRCCRRLRVKIWGPQIEWKKASEHLHMAILNELSSRYSQGHFGHGIIGLKIPSTVQPKHTQLDVVSETFCFGLTCEQNKDVRAKKVRVMIVAKDFLRHQVSNSAPEPKLERPGHWVRWRTLLEMKQIMEEEERLRAQGIRRVSRVWEVTLSFMVPRLRTTSMLTWQKESVMTNLDALSKQLRMSSDMMSSCTGQGPRGRQRRPVADTKKFQTSPNAESRAARASGFEAVEDVVKDSGETGTSASESKKGLWKNDPLSQSQPAPSVAVTVNSQEESQETAAKSSPVAAVHPVSVQESEAAVAPVTEVAQSVAQSAAEIVSPATEATPVESSLPKEQVTPEKDKKPAPQVTPEEDKKPAPELVQSSSEPEAKQPEPQRQEASACTALESPEATEPVSAEGASNTEASKQEQQADANEKKSQENEKQTEQEAPQESKPDGANGRRASSADYDEGVEVESLAGEEQPVESSDPTPECRDSQATVMSAQTESKAPGTSTSLTTEILPPGGVAADDDILD